MSVGREIRSVPQILSDLGERREGATAHHRVAVNARHSFDAANAVAFAEHSDRRNLPFFAQFISHTVFALLLVYILLTSICIHDKSRK